MGYCLITFRSVTTAQRGESVLSKAGISCGIHRTPRWMEAKGCGYSLRVRRQDALRCGELLRVNRVPMKKIYCMEDDGTGEELVL